jgi:hypothetical protein
MAIITLNNNSLSGVTALPAGVGGSLVKLAETSASSISSVDLNGYFTSDYDIYKVYIDGIVSNTNGNYLGLQFNTGSYTTQTTSYWSASASAYVGSTSGISYTGSNNTNYIKLSDDFSSTSNRSGTIDLTVYNPLSTTYTKGVTFNFQGGEGSIDRTRDGAGGGIWNNTTAITGLHFFNNQGSTFSARKIRLYGIKN